MVEKKAEFIPSYPYGDPANGWRVDREDFYKHVDAAFDRWYDSEVPQSNLGSAMPYELTVLEPEHRKVNWTNLRTPATELRREWTRKVHPEVAAEAERVDRLEPRATKEDVRRPFAPSPLACYRRGFAEGVTREKSRAGADAAVGDLERYYVRRMISRDGADAVRTMFENLISELQAEREAGVCSHPQVGHPCIRARQCPSCGATVPPEE